jgi:serine protease Do
VNKDLADSFGLDRARGALVSAVEPNSPADKAGLKSGDIVVAVDGKQINESVDLPRIIAETKPGAAVNMQLWSKGATRNARVTVGEMPSDRVAAAPTDEQTSPTKLGVVVRPLSEQERSASRVDGGVVVEQADGAAARAGIRPGDVILAFGNEKVQSPEQLRNLVEKAKGNVALLVKREEATIYVPIRIG